MHKSNAMTVATYRYLARKLSNVMGMTLSRYVMAKPLADDCLLNKTH